MCQHNKVQKIAKPRHTQKRRNKPGEPDIPQSSSELFCWALLLTISAVYSLGSCLSTFKSVLSHRLLPVACAINRNVVVFLPAPVSSSSPFLFFHLCPNCWLPCRTVAVLFAMCVSYQHKKSLAAKRAWNPRCFAGRKYLKRFKTLLWAERLCKPYANWHGYIQNCIAYHESWPL